MKYLYLKGMSATPDELEFIKNKFAENDMVLENLVDNYADFYKMKDDDIEKLLSDKINAYDDDICLICHSMGCNFGVLAATNIPNLKNIIFISPEWYPVSKEEMKAVIPSDNEELHPSKTQPFSLNKLKSIKVFFDSKKYILQGRFYFLFFGDIPKEIYYSKGDKYVSKKGINNLINFKNVEVTEIDTNNHNPLLETDEIVLKIKEMTETKQRN